MEPEHPGQSEAGANAEGPEDDRPGWPVDPDSGSEPVEDTADLTSELAPLASEAPYALWPQFDELDAGVRGHGGGGAGDPDSEWEGGFGLSGLALVVLLGALGIVTFGGIAIGKAVKPSATAVATTTTAPAPVTTVQKPRPGSGRPRPVTRWGPLSVKTVGHFAPSARAAVAISGATLVVAGGTGSRVLAGPVDGRLRAIAALPGARSAASAFGVGGAVYVLGGEQGSTPTAQVVRIDASAGTATAAGSFEEPLAEAAAVPSAGGAIIVGGWTGEKEGTAVLRYTPGGSPTLIARLPQGVRSPAAALVGRTLVVAGGLTQSGLSRQVYGIDLDSGGVKVLAALPQGLERATLLAVGSKLYLVGGVDSAGKQVATIVRIDPARGQAVVAGNMPHPLADAVAVKAGAQSFLVDTRGGVVDRIG